MSHERSGRGRNRWFAVCLLSMALAGFAPAPSQMEGGEIAVSASPVHLNSDDPGLGAVGDLTWLGGLRLSSDDERFGGFSGIELDYAGETRLEGGIISDAAFAGRIAVSLNDRAAPRSVTLSGERFRGEDGEPLNKREGDAEGLAAYGALIAVSFEQDHRIEFFHPGGDTRVPGPVAEGIDNVSANQGLEALTFMDGGLLLAGEESVTLTAAPHPVWRFSDPEESAPAAFQLAAAGPGYGLVGFDETPKGNLLILERFYAPGIGNSVVIRWLDGATARQATGLVTPRTLGVIEGSMTKDNFEGITAVEMPDGRTGIWIVSDDNFSARQQTLLMGFAFDETALAEAES